MSTRPCNRAVSRWRAAWRRTHTSRQRPATGTKSIQLSAASVCPSILWSPRIRATKPIVRATGEFRDFDIYTFIEATPDPVTGVAAAPARRRAEFLAEVAFADRLGLDV